MFHMKRWKNSWKTSEQPRDIGGKVSEKKVFIGNQHGENNTNKRQTREKAPKIKKTMARRKKNHEVKHMPTPKTAKEQ